MTYSTASRIGAGARSAVLTATRPWRDSRGKENWAWGLRGESSGKSLTGRSGTSKISILNNAQFGLQETIRRFDRLLRRPPASQPQEPTRDHGRTHTHRRVCRRALPLRAALAGEVRADRVRDPVLGLPQD